MARNLPPGWSETDKDYFEHTSGAVVHRSHTGRLHALASGGDPAAQPVQWRAHISKRYTSMLEELFDSPEAAIEALAPEIESRKVM